jgi:multiple sugar transport system ATP-binding protein
MRAEALTPVPPDAPGDVLQGHIRYLEHHGHESLAFLDIGATAIVLDDLVASAADADAGGGRLSRLTTVVQRLTGRGGERVNGHLDPGAANGSRGVLSDPGRHHRRPAELAVRLAPYPAVSPGHPLAISVRMDALHFFDERGQRIDVGWR